METTLPIQEKRKAIKTLIEETNIQNQEILKLKKEYKEVQKNYENIFHEKEVIIAEKELETLQ